MYIQLGSSKQDTTLFFEKKKFILFITIYI